MNKIIINNKISYLEATNEPLSSDVGIIKSQNGSVWLFDVGNNEEIIKELNGSYNVVLSHFHKDHIGNLDAISIDNLYVSNKTYEHTKTGQVVSGDLYFDDLHLFTLPSSHAKGCLGLEIDEQFAFVGDGLYSKVDNEYFVYNSQLLKEEIEVIKKLKAEYLLASHFKGMIRKKDDVISELEKIYKTRTNSPYIYIKKRLID